MGFGIRRGSGVSGTEMDTENRHYKLTTLIDGARERDAGT